MEPKVLADALVEAGIGYDGYKFYMGESLVSPRRFITDWRVAGKCLESMSIEQIADEIDIPTFNVNWLRDPREIIEAWYEAQNND